MALGYTTESLTLAQGQARTECYLDRQESDTCVRAIIHEEKIAELLATTRSLQTSNVVSHAASVVDVLRPFIQGL